MIADIVVHIVDDEEPVRNSLAFLLGAAGFAVRTHASATAFLEVAADIRNGCLVTDLRMPDIDGVELLRQLRAREAMLPAIVVTGHGDVQMAVEAMKNGAIDFIEKPFLSEREVQVLKGVVQGQPNKIIAFELGISPRTVEVYRANLMSKMQAKSLAELVRMVMDIDLNALVPRAD